MNTQTYGYIIIVVRLYCTTFDIFFLILYSGLCCCNDNVQSKNNLKYKNAEQATKRDTDQMLDALVLRADLMDNAHTKSSIPCKH